MVMYVTRNESWRCIIHACDACLAFVLKMACISRWQGGVNGACLEWKKVTMKIGLEEKEQGRKKKGQTE